MIYQEAATRDLSGLINKECSSGISDKSGLVF